MQLKFNTNRFVFSKVTCRYIGSGVKCSGMSGASTKYYDSRGEHASIYTKSIIAYDMEI